MAELEVAGIKFRGGKIFLILTVLSSLCGALWGGFEFYKDYQNMRNKISKYTAPDLSGFDKRIALVDQEIKAVNNEMSMIIDEVTLEELKQ